MKITILLIILFFASCISQQKAYKIVANDTFRSNAELTTLAKISEIEFPFKPTDIIIDTVIDSTAYLSYIKYLEETAMSLQDTLVEGQSIRKDLTGWVRINNISDLSKSVTTIPIEPPAITKTITKTVQVEDQAAKQIIQSELDNCRTENDKLAATITTQNDKISALDKTKWWLIGILSLIGIGGITTTVLKLKKVI